MSPPKLPKQTLVSFFPLILPFFLLFNFSLSQHITNCHPHDKNVLIRIKNHLRNPTTLATWTASQKDCCGQFHGVVCNSQGRVTSITINDISDYNDTIPSFLDQLPWLTSLSFTNIPNLFGPIPSYIGNLNNLISLSIVSTNLGGPIPCIITRLPKLITLSLSDNKHIGPIPRFLTRLPDLARLDLSSNELTGPIPASLGRLRWLYSLELSSNRLTGPIPLPLARLTELSILNLTSNKLSGPVPNFTGNQFTELDLNNLSGQRPGPSHFRNQLSGPAHESLGSANVVAVGIAHRKLSGGDKSFLFNENKGQLSISSITTTTNYVSISQMHISLSLCGSANAI